jgi:hypothetical protein
MTLATPHTASGMSPMIGMYRGGLLRAEHTPHGYTPHGAAGASAVGVGASVEGFDLGATQLSVIIPRHDGTPLPRMVVNDPNFTTPSFAGDSSIAGSTAYGAAAEPPQPRSAADRFVNLFEAGDGDYSGAEADEAPTNEEDRPDDLSDMSDSQERGVVAVGPAAGRFNATWRRDQTLDDDDESTPLGPQRHRR